MEMRDVLREKLDIKLLILFILRRLPGRCRGETLLELAMAEGTVGYFEYAECLSELLDSQLVDKDMDGYQITEKGDKNCAIVESSLPYTIRSRISAQLRPLAESMRRQAAIGAKHEVGKDGCQVELSLSDGVGCILELRVLCAGEEQAGQIEKNFRDSAEDYYHKIVELLTAPPEKKD